MSLLSNNGKSLLRAFIYTKEVGGHQEEGRDGFDQADDSTMGREGFRGNSGQRNWPGKEKNQKTEEIELFSLPAGSLSNQQMKLFRAWRETKLRTNIC